MLSRRLHHFHRGHVQLFRAGTAEGLQVTGKAACGRQAHDRRHVERHGAAAFGLRTQLHDLPDQLLDLEITLLPGHQTDEHDATRGIHRTGQNVITGNRHHMLHAGNRFNLAAQLVHVGRGTVQ